MFSGQLTLNTVMSARCLLWFLLLFSSPHPGWSTNSLERKMTNMMERMTRIEATKDTMISMLRTEAETRESRLSALESELEGSNAIISALRKEKKDRIAELEEEVRRLASRLGESEEAELELREMLEQVRNRMVHSSSDIQKDAYSIIGAAMP